MDLIRCPKCLEENDADKLAENTEYGCWTGPEVDVDCLHCEFRFQVSCEHAGYIPDEDFHVYAFMRVHKIKAPDDIHNFVSTYLHQFVEDGKASLIKSKEYPEYDVHWEAAYHFAKKEWNRVKNEMGRE